MLYGPKSQSKEQSDADRRAVAPEVNPREIHPRFNGADGLAGDRSRAKGIGQRVSRMQQAMGNQGMLRMLSRSTPRLQTKLTVNQPGDQFEQEADQVAEQVMRMSAPAMAPEPTSATDGDESRLQRKCDCGGSGGGCESCKEHEEEKLHRKAASPGAAPGAAPPIVHEVLRSPGQPLDRAARAFFEPRFGCDFSGVQVHTDRRAAESARAVNAQAYAVGSHVVFGTGRYSPSTRGGAWLLAHELAHVVQQQSSARHTPAALALDGEGGAGEQAADSAADSVLADRRVSALNGSAAVVQRKTITSTDKISDDERLIHYDDGSARRVRRVHWTTMEPGPANWAEATPGIDLDQVWLEIEWCAGENHGTVTVGADIPKQVINLIVSTVTSGGDINTALRGVNVTPFVQLNMLQSGTFRIEASGDVTLDLHGKVSGGEGRIGVSKGPFDFTIGAGSRDVGGRPDVNVEGQVTFTPGRQTPKEHCQREKKHAVDHTRFECSNEPPPKKPDTPPKPAALPSEYVPLFFKWAKADPVQPEYGDMIRSIVDQVAQGYTIATIQGETSPEGPRDRPDLQPSAPGQFVDNKRLAEARAAAARDALRKALTDEIAKVKAGSGLSMRKEELDSKLKQLQAALDSLPPAGRHDPAEMFGDRPTGEEIPENMMFPGLQEQIGTPSKPDILEEHHVTGTGVAAEPRTEGETAASEFRTGQRAGRARQLSQAERLQAIYPVFRRALVKLDPPKPPPPDLKLTPGVVAPVVGESDACTDADEALFPDTKAGKKEEQVLKRKAASASGPQGAPPIVHEVLRSAGQQLDPATRAFFEPRFGFNFSDVRVHTDARAAQSANAVNALAYTVGSHVVFGEARFSPESVSGGSLLAHELTHVVQQSGVRPGSQVKRIENRDGELERDANGSEKRVVANQPLPPLMTRSDRLLQRNEKDKDEPPDCQMSAWLGGFVFTPDPQAKLQAGLIHPQLLGMVLKKLMGADYTAAFRDLVVEKWGDTPIFGQQPGKGEGDYTAEEVRGPTAQGTEKMPRVTWAPSGFHALLGLCAKLGKPITLSEDHQRFLLLGEAAEFAYTKLGFPAWFTKNLFVAVMANRAKLLSDLVEARKQDSDPDSPSQATEAQVAAITSSLSIPVYVVDSVRTDPALVKHDVYQSMWPSPKGKGEKAEEPTMAAESREPRILVTAGLIAYADARPLLSKEALNSSDARKKLLDSYAVASTYRTTFTPGKRDQKLSDFPTQYTAPPYPATLSVYPTLEASLYGSTRSEYGFTMALEFPTLFSAFQFHDYDFALYRVPDDKLINASKALQGSGTHPSRWEALKGKVAQDERYREADIQAYANTIWDQIGPPGKTVDLINLNAAMRVLGSALGTVAEAVADPSYTARFNFEKEGLYVVQSVAVWDPGEEVVLKRPPSVAYQFLFARDPALLAEMRLQSQISEIDEAKKKLPTIIKQIGSTSDPKALKDLQNQKKQLEAIIGGVEGLLTYQSGELATSGDKDAAGRAEKLQEILNTRKARGFGQDSERLPAVYVSDSGQILDLLIEVRAESVDPEASTGTYIVNDATTPDSKSASASGPRRDAIKQALQELFRASDYGRGRASVRIDGVLEPIDVPTVSVGKLFTEAAGNAATLLSVIAVAAAPFTGGASMSLMVPAMIIGAVPSAYNIVTRGIDHTLHFDLALAMDVANVVGALVGVGAETRAGMQAIRLGTTAGRVLIVTGLGVMGTSVLLMSEGVLEQIEAVENNKDMPDGLRSAEIMKIIGHFMVNAGIMVGGILAAHAKSVGDVPLSFDDWLGELDSSTRERVLESKTEVDPARNFWKIYSEMDPVVRDLLTQCGSDCIPMDPPPSKADQARIKKLADGLSRTAKRTLKGLLHENRGPAAMDTVLSAIEEARNKAPQSKGSAKKIAAVEQAVLARGTGADYILANFSEEPVEALDKDNPGKWKRARQLADDIAKAAKLDLEEVGKVLDNVRRIPGGDPEEILGFLKKLSDLKGKADGIDKIMGADGLGGTYTKFKGARWTMRFLSEAGLWDNVKSFEDPVTGALFDRVVDVRLSDGTRIEMKSWERWHAFADVGFSRQIMADWLPTNGLRDPLIWAFEPGSGIGTAADVIARMEAALDTALQEKWPGYDDAFAERRVQAIKDKLPDIVRVGSK